MMQLHRTICGTELCVDIKVNTEIQNGFNIMTETKPCVRAHVRTIAPRQASDRVKKSGSSSVYSAAGFHVNGLFSQLLLLSEPLIVVCTHYLRQTRSEKTHHDPCTPSRRHVALAEKNQKNMFRRVT